MKFQGLCVSLLCLTSLSTAYQDNGKRNITFWPPINGQVTNGSDTYIISDPCNFKITSTNISNDIATIIGHYRGFLFPNCVDSSDEDDNTKQILLDDTYLTLTELIIDVIEPNCTFPKPQEDEAYVLKISPVDAKTAQAVLQAQTYFGFLKGIETFSQMVMFSTVDGQGKVYNVQNGPWKIEDAPEFYHRGVLVDVARTFLPLATIKNIIDGMMYSKMNTLHLHITDSQSFPIEVTDFYLTENGAVSSDKFYSKEDIADLVNYARLRGVRVMPEIDTPGHARSFGLAPNMTDIVSCAHEIDWESSCAEPPCGQLNPTSDKAYTTMGRVFHDIVAMFPDLVLHVGYDEVNYNCWEIDPSIQSYNQSHGGNVSAHDLLIMFNQRQRDILKTVAPDRNIMFWEEAANQNLTLYANDTVQVWSDQDSFHHILTTTPAKVVISWSQKVYLDCGHGNMFGANSWCDPFHTWYEMYSFDPLANTTSEQAHRVIGGEAAMWGELTNSEVIVNRIFPRAAAYSARLWSYKNVLPLRDAILSLQAHTDRLNARGVAASNIMLPYCQLFPDMCFEGLGKTVPENRPDKLRK